MTGAPGSTSSTPSSTARPSWTSSTPCWPGRRPTRRRPRPTPAGRSRSVRPVEFVLDAGAADRGAGRGHRLRRVRRRHRDGCAVVPGRRHGAHQGTAHVAGRLRAARVPAGPPTCEGPRRSHLRVHRDPAVPARAHRGDARRHPRGAGVRRADGRRRRRRRHPSQRLPRRRSAATASAPGSASPARPPSSTCGSCRCCSSAGRTSGCASRSRCTSSPGWTTMRDDFLSTELRAVPTHLALRVRLDQRPVHRRRLRAAARPLQRLPEHPPGGRARRSRTSRGSCAAPSPSSTSCWPPSPSPAELSARQVWRRHRTMSRAGAAALHPQRRPDGRSGNGTRFVAAGGAQPQLPSPRAGPGAEEQARRAADQHVVVCGART